MRGPQRDQRLQIGREVKHAPTAGEHGRLHLRHRHRLRRVAQPGHCVDDRPIPGAATQIAGQRLMRVAPLERERPGRHHEAGRAEPALRGIPLRKGDLCGVRLSIASAEALDGAHAGAMQLPQHRQARIDRRPPAIPPLEHHGASAAIALGTPLLRARQARWPPQPAQQRHARGHVRADVDHRPIQPEAHIGVVQHTPTLPDPVSAAQRRPLPA